MTFAVPDTVVLACYPDASDTVIDVGMFHCLDEASPSAYASSVHRATRAGAKLLMACFSDIGQQDADLQSRGISEQVFT